MTRQRLAVPGLAPILASVAGDAGIGAPLRALAKAVVSLRVNPDPDPRAVRVKVVRSRSLTAARAVDAAVAAPANRVVRAQIKAAPKVSAPKRPKSVQRRGQRTRERRLYR